LQNISAGTLLRSTPKISRSPSHQKLTETLVYPDAVKIIVDLLRSAHNADMIIHVFGELKRTLTRENMAILWDAGWAEWFSNFVEATTNGINPDVFASVRVRVDMIVYSQMTSVVQKMMIYDMKRCEIVKCELILLENTRQSQRVEE
jgi:hypothetical protein